MEEDVAIRVDYNERNRLQEILRERDRAQEDLEVAFATFKGPLDEESKSEMDKISESLEKDGKEVLIKTSSSFYKPDMSAKK